MLFHEPAGICECGDRHNLWDDDGAGKAPGQIDPRCDRGFTQYTSLSGAQIGSCAPGVSQACCGESNVGRRPGRPFDGMTMMRGLTSERWRFNLKRPAPSRGA